ncbi:MAG TPA: IS1595 family transposase [Roseiarcus sp.]|nr:IS1595 family transposase [Roseiarcus sp.]
MTKYTFNEFQAEYPDDAACLAKLMEINYGGTHIACPSCGVLTNFHPMSQRRAYACQECGHHVYPCADTIFHKSRTKLTHWFFAMYLMTSTRHGVAAKELQRQIGVTYKCAWRMCHELRKLMASADHQGPLSGHVEIDETRVGGYQSRFDRRRKGDNKTTVMGLVERNGNLRAGPIDDLSGAALERIVTDHVAQGSAVSTDEWRGYVRLNTLGYDHGRVNHSQEEWVRGSHHTNTIEGHWSLLKRAIKGTHVHISTKHAWKYVAEFSYRRNFRSSHAGMFNRLVASFSLPRLVET